MVYFLKNLVVDLVLDTRGRLVLQANAVGVHSFHPSGESPETQSPLRSGSKNKFKKNLAVIRFLLQV